MNEPKRIEIQRWLIKSQHDLGSARLLMSGKEALCYRSQRKSRHYEVIFVTFGCGLV